MMVRLRNKKWHIRIRQNHREMWFTCSAKGKREAEWIAAAVKTAIKTRDFAALDSDSAESMPDYSATRDGRFHRSFCLARMMTMELGRCHMSV